MKLDLRTERQKNIARRADLVCSLYKKHKKGYIGSPTALWGYIAKQASADSGIPLSAVGVMKILIRNRLYVPRKLRAQ